MQILEDIQTLFEIITKADRERYAELERNKEKYIVRKPNTFLGDLKLRWQLRKQPEEVKRAIRLQLATPHQKGNKVFIPDSAKELDKLGYTDKTPERQIINKALSSFPPEKVEKHELAHLALNHHDKLNREVKQLQDGLKNNPGDPNIQRRASRMVMASDYGRLKREAEADKLAFNNKQETKQHLHAGGYAAQYYKSNPEIRKRYIRGRIMYKTGASKVLRGVRKLVNRFK